MYIKSSAIMKLKLNGGCNEPPLNTLNDVHTSKRNTHLYVYFAEVYFLNNICKQ